MSAYLSYRAELANQVFVRLRRLDEQSWESAERAAVARGAFFDLGYALAHDAVSLLVEEFGPDIRAVVDARLSDVDALLSNVPVLESLEPLPVRWRIGRAAVLAAFLRDSCGFNLGAFQELFAPVAPLIDFAEVERTALASLGAERGDFQVVRDVPPSRVPKRDVKHA